MLLIGLKSETTSTGEWSSVTHQRMDIIAGSPTDASETLAELYHAMVKQGEDSSKKLSDLSDRCEDLYSDITEKQFEKLQTKYLKDIYILRYDKVLIIDGIILK